MWLSIRRARFLVMVAAALTWPSGSILAFEINCIEASKYKYIWKLFGDDKEKFAEFFQVGRVRLPQADMCRAAILTGTIGDLKSALIDEREIQRELAKLVEVIKRNKGWLAEIYLSSPGGQLTLSMFLGELVRTSWLKTTAVDDGGAAYSPDIISITPSSADRSAYEAATKELRRIRIPESQRKCGSSCSAIHVAGVERRGSTYVHRSRAASGAKPRAPAGGHLFTVEEEAGLFLAYLQRMDAGSDVIRKTAATPTTMVARVQSPKYPNKVRDLMKECGLDSGTADADERRVRSEPRRTSKRSSESEQPKDTPPANQAERAKAESCLASRIERGRLERFDKVCPESTCDIEALYLATRFSLFLGVAETGNAFAQIRIAEMYDNGQGVPQDFAEAVKWYRKAAEQGDDAAQYNLGFMLANGQGVPQDFAEAAKWYRKAADQGFAAAQHNLGVMFANGPGVPQDFVEAAKWYRKAADQGLAAAQHNLGVMFSNGQGMPQDFSEAMKWYRKAADQGLAVAQYNLGVVFTNGQGVPQDLAEGAKWHHKAADQGFAAAQYNLGVRYEFGSGVAKNMIEALKWYLLAAKDEDFRDSALGKRDSLVSTMTTSEIKEAEQRARAWTESHKEQ